MSRSTAGRIAALLGLLAGLPARAHQAPSPDANNRYLKVTLLPEKLRLAYTLLYGERPGAAERRRMDRSGDGVLDEHERATFAAQLLAEIAPVVTVDGQAAAGWRVADVGVGEPPRTAGGTFAIDLALDAPYPDPRAETHTLVVDDRAALPQAGEVELRIDESPGVRIAESHLAREAEGIELRYVFTGNAVSPGERAVEVRFSVGEELRPRAPRWPYAAAGLVVVFLVLAGLRARARPRDQRKV